MNYKEINWGYWWYYSQKEVEKTLKGLLPPLKSHINVYVLLKSWYELFFHLLGKNACSEDFYNLFRHELNTKMQFSSS